MSEEPDNYMKWLVGLRQEDEDMGYGYIRRTENQLKELYTMYPEDHNSIRNWE